MNITKDNKKNNKTTQILLSLLYVASCIFTPLILNAELGEWLTDALSLTMSILSLVAFSKVAKGFRFVFLYAFILGATLFIGGGFVIMGMFASLINSICLFSYLCLKSNPYITLALPAVAYIPALAITKDPLSSLAVFFALPASILCVYALKKKKPRVSAITHISIGLCISFAAVLVVAVYKISGGVSLEGFQNLIQSARELFTSILHDAVNLIGDSAEEMIGANIDFDLFAENLVTLTFNLLPAITVILFNAISYLVHTLTLTLVFNEEKEKENILPMLSFEMSIHSAFIFLTAVILSFILVSDSTALYGAVAENVLIILLPGFILTALTAVRFFIAKRSPSCLSTLLYFALIFMIASFSYPILLTVALAGAIIRIVIFFKKKSKEQKS